MLLEKERTNEAEREKIYTDADADEKKRLDKVFGVGLNVLSLFVLV